MRTRQEASIKAYIELNLNYLDDKENHLLQVRILRGLLHFLDTNETDDHFIKAIQADSSLKAIYDLFSSQGAELKKVFGLDDNTNPEFTLTEIREVAIKLVQGELEKEEKLASELKEPEKELVATTFAAETAQLFLTIDYETMPILQNLGFSKAHWEALQKEIISNHEGNMQLHIPVQFAEQYESVIKLRQQHETLKQKAAAVNENLQTQSMEEFIVTTQTNRLNTLTDTLNNTDIRSVFIDEETTQSYFDNYFEAGEIFNDHLGQYEVEDLAELYGVQLTENLYRIYGNNLIEALKVCASEFKAQATQLRDASLSFTSINFVKLVYELALKAAAKFPFSKSTMLNDLRGQLNLEMWLLQNICYQASLTGPQSTNRMHSLHVTTAQQYEDIFKLDPKNYLSISNILYSLSLYHALNDQQGIKSSRERLIKIIQEHISIPIANLENKSSQCRTLDERYTILEKEIAHLLLGDTSIYVLFRKIRVEGVDDDLLAELNWEFVTLGISKLFEHLEQLTLRVVDFKNKALTEGDNSDAQKKYELVFERLENNLVLYHRFIKHIYNTFFTNLPYSATYKDAFLAQLSEFINKTVSLSAYCRNNHVMLQGDLSKLSDNLKILQNEVRSHTSPSRITNDAARIKITELELLCARLRQGCQTAEKLSDIINVYDLYIQTRDLENFLEKRILPDSHDLRMRIRLVKDMLTHYRKNFINQNLKDFFLKNIELYKQTKNFDLYDEMLRTFTILYPKSLTLSQQYAQADELLGLKENTHLRLVKLLSIVNQRLGFPMSEIVKFAELEQQVIPQGHSGEQIGPKHELFTKCANLLMDFSSIYVLLSKPLTQVAENFHRAKILYSICGNIEKATLAIQRLNEEVSKRLYEPLRQQFEENLRNTDPTNASQQANTLLKTLQSLDPQNNSRPHLPKLQTMCDIRKISDNPVLRTMHTYLSMQYLSCIMRANIPLFGLSTENELTSTRFAFSEVYMSAFKNFKMDDTQKMEFNDLCAKVAESLFLQIEQSKQQHRYPAIVVLENHIEYLMGLIMSNLPSCPLRELEERVPGFLEKLLLMRVRAKEQAVLAHISMGRPALILKPAEEAITLAKEGLQKYNLSPSIKNKLEEITTAMLVHVNRHEEQQRRPKRILESSPEKPPPVRKHKKP